MILDEMNIAYLKIKEQYRSGQIEMNQLTLAIDKLRLVSSDGTQWRINQNGEGWLYWNEDHWKRGTPGKDPTLKPLFEDWKTLANIEHRPQSTWEFMSTFLKGLTLKYIKQVPKKVIVAILIVFAFNALTNYMYAKTYYPFLDRLARMLQTRTGLFTRFVYYYALTLIIGSLIKNRKTLIKAFPAHLSSAVSEISAVIKNIKASTLGILLGTLAGLFLGKSLEGRIVELLLIVVFLTSLSHKSTSSFITLLQLVQEDLCRLIRKDQKQSHEIPIAFGLVLGLVLSLALGDIYASYALYITLAGSVIALIATRTMSKEVQK